MRKYLLVVFILQWLVGNRLYAQCEVTATALPSDITCGTCVTLTAFGEGQGNSVFTESFNSGAPTGWQSTAQATYSNPCDPSGVDGTPHLWMGDATGVPRQMTTTNFDFSGATAGATICFDMLFAEQGDASPCEGPDEPDEGVYLQYSTDNGVTWVTIHYFDPNGGNDASLINWNNWCFPLPPAALTANTQIRWFQDNDSGADYDHWGLDNVNIYFNDPTYNITWTHDGYSYGVGNAGGDNPTPVCPQTTTTYTVTMTNGTTTCTDQVTVNVVPPVFRVTAAPDTTICDGQCVDLNAEASIIVSPAKTPTYSNSEVAALTGLPTPQELANLLLPCTNFSGCTCPDGSTVPFLGNCPTIYTATLSMNINITDLNTTSLQSGQLTQVCIGDALMVAGDLTPFEVSLDCPGGSSIILANAGDLTGTTLTNTCFDLTSTTPVSAGSSPYNGTFQPINPLTNLNGCDPNGVWTLNFTGTFDLSGGTLPVGFLNGWDISFDDPEIIYTGIFNWSPTTNMTSSNTLTPNVCPSADQTYTITVADTAGCASDSATVTVNVITTNCCPIDIAYTSVAPTCGNTDGSIDVTISGGSGNYGYQWSNGLPATEDATNLGGGTYTFTVFDSTLACQKDTVITILAPNSPQIDSVEVTGTSCGLSNGSVTITASGGTAPLMYSIDGGGTTQMSNVFSNLTSGSLVVTVVDGSGCDVSQTVIIDTSSAPVIDSLSVVQASCGLSNGSITVNFSGGVAPHQFSIDNGVSYSSNNVFANLPSGNYTVLVEDANACVSAAQSAIINPSEAVSLDSTQVVAPNCNASDGQVSIFASGGNGSLSYSIDGVSFQASNVFSSLPSGLYTAYVQDSQGCLDSLAFNLVPLDAPVIDSVITGEPSCGSNDGTIEVQASGGTGALSYSIDGLNFQASPIFFNLAGGTYTIEVEDATNCGVSQLVVLNVSSLPTIDLLTVNPSTCGLPNGSIDIQASGGTPPLAYSIDNGLSFQSNGSFTGLSDGNYTVVVQEQGNPLCTVDSVVTISASPGPSIVAVNVVDESCDGLDDGSIELTVSGGVTPYDITYNGVPGSATNTDLSPGTYTITIEDGNNCQLDTVVDVNAGPSLSLVASNDTLVNQGATINLFSQGQGTSNGVYLWSPGAGLSCLDCPNPTALITDDITYTVSFADSLSNCSVSEEVNIEVILEEVFCLFPDAFSPNLDLVNDGFGPICNELSYVKLKIYNRWGELLFSVESDNDLVRWDGTYKGKNAPLDVYVYVANIEYTNGDVEVKTGNFTLIR